VEAFYINQQGHWELQEHKEKKESLFIRSIDLTIPLTEIYDRTKL